MSWDYVIYRNVADIHRACKQFRIKDWRRLIDEIKADERQRLVANGDWAHTALKDSKSDVYQATMDLDTEIDTLAEEVYPIRDRIDAIDDGNHEERSHRLTTERPMKRLAEKLGIKDKYNGESSVVKVTFGTKPNGKRSCVVIYAQHGFGAGKRKGAVANMLEDMGNIFPTADIYFGAHQHIGMSYYDSIPVSDLQNNRILFKRRLFVATSSLTGYEPWLERIGRKPTAVVVPMVRIQQDKTFSVTM
jgi:hypothetical protein